VQVQSDEGRRWTFLIHVTVFRICNATIAVEYVEALVFLHDFYMHRRTKRSNYILKLVLIKRYFTIY
jgi:hypothetical protein